MSVDVDQSAIPPLIVFEEPLASFTSSSPCPSSLTSSPLPGHPPSTRHTTTSVPLTVSGLFFDEVASDVVLLTNENTICFYHVTLSRTPVVTARPPAESLGTLARGSPPPPPLHAATNAQQLANTTDAALCLTVQRRMLQSGRSQYPSRAAGAAGSTAPEAHTAALVSVRAARRCPTTFLARTTGSRHGKPSAAQELQHDSHNLTEAEASSELLAYQLVAVSCEESAVYLYRCFNAQSELTETVLTTIAGHSTVPLAAFAVYQCVPNNVRFRDPCYPIRSFYWVMPSDDARVPPTSEDPGVDAPLLTADGGCPATAPRLLCVTSIGLELIRLGTAEQLDAAAYHQSTRGAEGLPTVLTLLHAGSSHASSAASSAAAREDRFTRDLISGWAMQERYPTRIQHWYYHPTTRLVLVVRDREANMDALRKADCEAQQQQPQRGAHSATSLSLSVTIKPFEVSPARLRPMCRLELPSLACTDLVRALHHERQTTATPTASLSASPTNQTTHAEDPRMLASRALSAHMGVLLLYGKVFIYHVVARDAVVMLYQYCARADTTASTTYAANGAVPEATSSRPAAASTPSASSFQVTHTSAGRTSATHAASATTGSKPPSACYERRLALDLRGFTSFRRYQAWHQQQRQRCEATSPPSLPAASSSPPPTPPPLVVQVSDNMLLLHAPEDAISAVFDIAGLSACVEVEQRISLSPTHDGSTETTRLSPAVTRANAAVGEGPLYLRLNAVVGRHARPVSLPMSAPRDEFAQALPASALTSQLTGSDGGEEWISVTPSGMSSRIGSAAQSLDARGTQDDEGRAHSAWSSVTDAAGLSRLWTGTRSAPPGSAFAAAISTTSSTTSAAPPRYRMPLGLHVYTTARLALMPESDPRAARASASTGSSGRAVSQANGRRENNTADPAVASRAASSRSRDTSTDSGVGRLTWLFGKLSSSLTGLDRNGDASTVGAVFGEPTPLCRAALQDHTPVPLLPPLVTAPLVPYAVNHTTYMLDCPEAPSPLQRWYTACRFSRDGSTLPLLFDAQKLPSSSSVPSAPPRTQMLFSVRLVMANPFAVAAAASARLNEPFAALALDAGLRARLDDREEEDDDEDLVTRALQALHASTHSFTGRDVAWRVSFYLRRLFCGGEAVPRMLRTMLRCSETTASDVAATVYSPEACSLESIATTFTAVVAHQASVRAARQAYATTRQQCEEANHTHGTTPPTPWLSEWDVYPGPVLGMSSATFFRALQQAAQAQLTAAAPSPLVARQRGGRVFTNHPGRVHETASYLAHFTASQRTPRKSTAIGPPAVASTGGGGGGRLTLPDVLAVCLLSPSNKSSQTSAVSSPTWSPSSLASASSPLCSSAVRGSTDGAGSASGGGVPLRVYRSFQQRLLCELVLVPAVQHAQAWAWHEGQTKGGEESHHQHRAEPQNARAGPSGLPVHPDSSNAGQMLASATAGMSTASRACRERFSFLLSALLSYSAALRDVGEVLTEDVQDLIVTALLASFPGSLKSLGRHVHKCLRRGLLVDRLSSALRLLQYRDAWVAAQVQHAHGTTPASPVRLLSNGGFDPQSVQDPLCTIVMGMLARCGGTYERVAVWLRRRDPLRAARDLSRYAATTPSSAVPMVSTRSEGERNDPEYRTGVVLADLVKSAEEDCNLLLASQDVLQCAASGVDEAEMGLMGPRRWSGVLGSSLPSPHRLLERRSGAHGSGSGGELSAASVLPNDQHVIEHASRKSRQLELQARRKVFVLVFQLLSGLVKSRIDRAYARRIVLESQLEPTTTVEEAADLKTLVTSIQIAEKMEVKMLEYGRRFIAVLHS